MSKKVNADDSHAGPAFGDVEKGCNEIDIDYMCRLTRPSIAYPEVRYDELLLKTAERFPYQPAIAQDGWLISYQSLNAWTNAVANLLRNSWGVREGDVVALSATLCAEAIIAYQAISRIGAIVTPINPLHNSSSDMEYQIKHSGAGMFIACSNTYSALEGLVGASRLLWYGNTCINLGSANNLLLQASRESVHPTSPPAIDHDDIAAIAYTSGTTTGTPKGIMLSHNNLVANAMQFASAQCLSGREVMLNGLPLLVSMHMGGAIVSGATMVLVKKRGAMELLTQAKLSMATQMYVGAPTVTEMGQMVDLERWRTPWLKSITGAASKLPTTVAEHVSRSLGVTVVQGYGLTEAAPFTHTHPVFPGYVAPPGSCGLSAPDTEQRIVDIDTGTVLPLGRHHVGELCIRGPQVMSGYLSDDVLTGATVRDRWLYTGDLASIDEQGYLYYLDRLADVIKTGAHYVVPMDLELLIRSHVDVQDCAVIGVDNDAGRQLPVAFVVLKPGAGIRQEELVQFANSKLDDHMKISQVTFVDSLPRSGIGKLLRRVVKGYASQGKLDHRMTTQQEAGR